MPHIAMSPELAPGTPGLFQYRPETGRPLGELAEVLLRNPHSLSRGDRELIAAYVSVLNQCRFCSSTHSEVSAAQISGGRALVDKVIDDLDSAPISAKLKALITIAGATTRGGHEVTSPMVDAARQAGATDTEIHDTVLIAAAFCMFTATATAWRPSSPTTPPPTSGWRR